MAWVPDLKDVAIAGLTVGGTYVSGDQLGNEIVVPGAATSNGQVGVITSIALVDRGDQIPLVDVFVFTDATTPAADNAVAGWSDADALKIVPGTPIAMPVATDLGGVRVTTVGNLWLPFKCGATHDDLFVDLVTRGGHSGFAAATDVALRLGLMKFS